MSTAKINTAKRVDDAVISLHMRGYKIIAANMVAEVLWPNGRHHNANGQVFHLGASVASRLLQKCRLVREVRHREWEILEYKIDGSAGLQKCS